MQTPSTVVVTAEAVASLTRHHPWVFAHSIARVEGSPEPGATVQVRGPDGQVLGCGAYSPASSLAVRMWRFDAADMDEDFLAARLAKALSGRRGLGEAWETDAFRLVHAEADGLPGLIVDRYADYLVCQFLAAGVERWRETLIRNLARLHPCAGIYERSDTETRAREGLPPRTGTVHGSDPPPLVGIREGPARFWVDVRQGHKTGFYLDQRENRARLDEFAGAAEVLNAYAYTGAFGVRALLAGAARVTHIETSGSALELGRRHAELNALSPDRWDDVEDSVPGVLRRLRDARRRFDLIVLDPPKFAESRRYVPAARRGYNDINRLAISLLKPDGILFTFSCSGHVDAALFERIVTEAADDAGRSTQILARLGQPRDHPGLLSFPEGTYLKGLICRAL